MDTNQKSPEYFSISEGGPFHNALVKVRFYNSPVKLIIVFLSVTWLPLLIITAFEGTLYSGAQLPFLKDIAMQMRLLMGLPILLSIRFILEGKVIDMEKYFFNTLMSDNEQRLILNKEFKKSRRLSNSTFAEIILLLMVIATTISLFKTGIWSGLQSSTESWMSIGEAETQTLSFAGKWVVFISIPVFQFLMGRWLWRYIVWVLHLFRLSKARLNLQPTHPDRAGGLGIILHIQVYFCLVFVALSTVAAGELAAQLIKEPGSFPVIKVEAIGCILLCILLVLLPLVFFAGKLIKTKHEGLMKLSNLGAKLSAEFEKEWINGDTINKKINETVVSTSTLQDYSTIYRSLERIRPVPVTFKDVISIAFILFIPYIPIVFIHFSILELWEKFLGLLL